MRLTRPLALTTVALALLAVAGCRADSPALDAAAAPGLDQPSAAAPAASAPTPSASISATPVPSRTAARPATSATSSPVRLSLRTVDWAHRSAPSTCSGAARGAAVYGDLDGDGRDEAALPFTCGATSRVLVYGGDGRAPRLLGEALAAAEHGRLQAVEVRDRRLVVSAFGWSGADRSGAPDLAVTTRWRVRNGALVRTDRWVDPAEVLSADNGAGGPASD